MGKNMEKDKALSQVLADIEKQFGKGAIMKLDEQENNEIEVCSSGSISLDIFINLLLSAKPHSISLASIKLVCMCISKSLFSKNKS